MGALLFNINLYYMNMKTILIDLDGPVANFEKGFVERWKVKFPNENYIPIEERKMFYLVKEYPQDQKEKVESIILEEGFFSSLEPTEGSIESIKEIQNAGHKIFFCTAGIYDNKNCLTEKKLWVENYFGHDLARTIVFTKDKTVIRGDYLIDDNPNIIMGEYIPEWELILFDQPFNIEIQIQNRLESNWQNWKDILV